MAFTPVEMTNGVDVQLAETPGELSTYVFDGWVALGELPPPSPSPSPGGQPNVTSLLTALEGIFVTQAKLRIQPTPPVAPEPGTVWINNAID